MSMFRTGDTQLDNKTLSGLIDCARENSLECLKIHLTFSFLKGIPLSLMSNCFT